MTPCVSKAKTELENSGKQFEPKSLPTDEKRERVREFIEDTPDRRTVSPRVLGDTERYQRGGVPPGVAPPSGDSGRIHPHIQRVPTTDRTRSNFFSRANSSR
jgi:hypothetical protein